MNGAQSKELFLFLLLLLLVWSPYIFTNYLFNDMALEWWGKMSAPFNRKQLRSCGSQTIMEKKNHSYLKWTHNHNEKMQEQFVKGTKEIDSLSFKFSECEHTDGYIALCYANTIAVYLFHATNTFTSWTSYPHHQMEHIARLRKLFQGDNWCFEWCSVSTQI